MKLCHKLLQELCVGTMIELSVEAEVGALAALAHTGDQSDLHPAPVLLCDPGQVPLPGAVGSGADFQKVLILQPQAGDPPDQGGEKALLRPQAFGDGGQQKSRDGPVVGLLDLGQKIAQGVLIPRRTLAAVIVNGFSQIKIHGCTSRMWSAAQGL